MRVFNRFYTKLEDKIDNLTSFITKNPIKLFTSLIATFALIGYIQENKEFKYNFNQSIDFNMNSSNSLEKIVDEKSFNKRIFLNDPFDELYTSDLSLIMDYSLVNEICTDIENDFFVNNDNVESNNISEIVNNSEGDSNSSISRNNYDKIDFVELGDVEDTFNKPDKKERVKFENIATNNILPETPKLSLSLNSKQYNYYSKNKAIMEKLEKTNYAISNSHKQILKKISYRLDEPIILNGLKTTRRDVVRIISNYADVPPEAVIALWYRENDSMKLDRYLHNGQKLGQETTLVPKKIFFHKDQFISAGIDAIKANQIYNNKNFYGLNKDSTDISAMAIFAEAYNGFGYCNLGVVSPYVFAGTPAYKSGLFVESGRRKSVYIPNKVDKRLGVYLIIKHLLEERNVMTGKLSD